MTNAKHCESALFEGETLLQEIFCEWLCRTLYAAIQVFSIVRDSFVGTPPQTRVLLHVAYIDGTDARVTLVLDTRVR